MKTPEIKRPAPMVHPCVVELRKMLQSVLGDDFVRLYHYGSRIEGGAESGSDYDVLCVTGRPLNRKLQDEVMDRRIDLQLTYNVLFDMHFFSSDEIKSPPVECLPYLHRVVADGILV